MKKLLLLLLTLQSLFSFDKSCIELEVVRKITGISLSGLVEDGQKVRLLDNYYKCNPPKVGQIALYRWGDRVNVAKVIKAIGGDKIEIKKIGAYYTLFINNKPAKNSLQEEYKFFDDRVFGVLKLYQGVIPKGQVLLLGNLIARSLDSKIFGLVPVSELKARLIPIKK